MKRKLIFFLSFILVVSPSSVFAQPKIEGDVLTDMVVGVIVFALPLASIIAVGMLVYGGYMWIVSAGDPARLKQAQGTITWAIIGLVFLGILGMLLALVLDYFGI